MIPHAGAFKPGHKPFAIGLRPLGDDPWIEPEPSLGYYLAVKEVLFSTDLPKVWMARGDTETAQAECLDLLISHLTDRHSDTYEPIKNGVRLGSEDLHFGSEPPLLFASRLVADDLVLMRKCDDGWRLVAASLCFPSSWSLAEKFDRPMEAIHEPVPDYEGRMGALINRVFDNLKPDLPVYRYNWSIYDTVDLHRPEPHENRSFRFGTSLEPERVFIRTERQTLAKMPESGDILFTIKISAASQADLASRSQLWRDAFAGLADQIEGMTEPQLEYKSIADHRDKLLRLLLAAPVGKAPGSSISEGLDHAEQRST
ncbi:MAG: DUF3445 domain-containing protein [Pseudomonadota bacterium]